MVNGDALYNSLTAAAVASIDSAPSLNPAMPCSDVLRLLIIFQDGKPHLPEDGGGLVDFINSTVRNPAHRLAKGQLRQYLALFEGAHVLEGTPDGYTVLDAAAKAIFPDASIPIHRVLDDLAEK